MWINYIKTERFTLFTFALLFQINKVTSSKPRPNITINFRQDLADVDYFNATFAAISNSYAAFDLICTAPYPIEWKFYYDKDDDGTSEQEKEAMGQRFVSNFSDPSTYHYVANISLRYNGKIFVFTSFSCRSIQNVDLQMNVILSPKERKNVIFMNVTSDPIKIEDNEGPSYNGSKGVCKTFAVVSDQDKLSSCWKCEKPDGTDLQLDFIGCNNPTECGSIFERHNMGKYCLKIIPNAVDDKAYLCRRIGAIDYNPKTLVCKNYGPVLTQLYFFGIPKIPKTAPKMYFDWTEVNPQEMIYIHELPKDLYFGQNLTVTCEMSRYYFSFGSWFGLQIGNNLSYYQMGDHIEDESRGTFISKFLLNLTNPSPDKLYCFAPVWNTSEWINASLSLNVEMGKGPAVISVVADASSKDFDVGQKNRSLTCTFVGEPTPNITWEGPKIGYFEVLENENNYSKVQIYPEYPGQYTCLAKSFLGEDSKSFNVTISDPALSTKMVKTILSVSALLTVALGIGVAFIVFRLCRVIRYQREALRLLTEAEIKEFVEGNPGFVAKNAYFDSNVVIEALPYDKRYEIAPQSLLIDKQNLLGSGAFGKVYKGKIKRRSINLNKPSNSSASSESHPQPEVDISQLKYEVVAVKTCGGDVDVMYFKALLSEVKIMAFIGHHKNVVSLIAACTQNIRNREVYIAVEFCPKGSLESFLKRHRNTFHNKVQYGMIVVDAIRRADQGYVSVAYNNIQLTEVSDIQLSTKDLLKWTMDVVCGLEFLHGKKVIHADLAVRNILLSEDLISKIGDFGLARQLVECSNYVKKTQSPLPWRHLAPESLRNLEFSLKSDVWSLAVAIWEIFTLSETPYSATSFNAEFILELEHGMRLSKPIFATNDLYEFMLKCWTINPDDRPGDFEELKALCTNSLRLFLEHESADDNEYLQLYGMEEGDGNEPLQETEGYLVPTSTQQCQN